MQNIFLLSDAMTAPLSVNESVGEVMVVKSVSIDNSQMDSNLGENPSYKAAGMILLLKLILRMKVLYSLHSEII